MTRYFFRRVLQGVPTFFGVTIISFLLMISAPGDPIQLITFNPENDPKTTEDLRRKLGLDQPPLVQYLYWLIGNDWAQIDLDGDGTGDVSGERYGLLRGDMGQSIRFKQPVAQVMVERIPATLQLTLSALIMGYIIGILFGVLSAAYQGTWVDQFVRLISVIGNAVPAFWLGLIFIIIFSVNLGWLPMSGSRNVGGGGAGGPLDTVRYMVMPVTVLALGVIANVSRFVRTSMLEVATQDYVRTARAKGLGESTITWRHIMRNALLPVATLLGPAIGGLLGGAVVIEQVFSWPGMGRLIVDGVFQRDYPLVMGSVVMGAVLFILGLIISDVLYVLIDPRIRLE